MTETKRIGQGRIFKLSRVFSSQMAHKGQCVREGKRERSQMEWNQIITGRHKIQLFGVQIFMCAQTFFFPPFFSVILLLKFLHILLHGRILPSAAIRAAAFPPKWKCSIIWRVLHTAAQYGPLRSVSGGSYVTDFLHKRQMVTM